MSKLEELIQSGKLIKDNEGFAWPSFNKNPKSIRTVIELCEEIDRLQCHMDIHRLILGMTGSDSAH